MGARGTAGIEELPQGAAGTGALVHDGGAALRDGVLARGRRRLERALIQIVRHHGPEGILARTVPTGNTVLWVALVLAVMLLLNFV